MMMIVALSSIFLPLELSTEGLKIIVKKNKNKNKKSKKNNEMVVLGGMMVMASWLLMLVLMMAQATNTCGYLPTALMTKPTTSI